MALYQENKLERKYSLRFNTLRRYEYTYVRTKAKQEDFPICRVQTKYQTQLVNFRMSQRRRWLDVGAPLKLTTVSSTWALPRNRLWEMHSHEANVWRVSSLNFVRYIKQYVPPPPPPYCIIVFFSLFLIRFIFLQKVDGDN